MINDIIHLSGMLKSYDKLALIKYNSIALINYFLLIWITIWSICILFPYNLFNASLDCLIFLQFLM